MKTHIPYRPDIDGLRALAVLPVLAFHAHVPGFSGGFVGVDIFFVISGFLITGILKREIDGRQFSLARFYERRARRILPALLVMIVFTLAMAAWLFLPEDFAGVPRSALMVLAFLSNIWFFLKTGYFAGGAETMPLLHCWSLAVEEQFYIGFPILLLLCAKWDRRWLLGLIIGIVAVSFLWAVWKQADPDAFAFYMLPTRAWELLGGGLLAVAALPEVRGRLLRECLALLGVGLILWAVFTYSPATVFPGVAALPPVLGAMLLIHCAPTTRVGWFLSLPLFVGIGLISYSLYLWHWPLIVFAEYAKDGPLEGMARILIIALAFLIAWIMWRFVERPFRDARLFNRRQIFTLSGVGIGAVALMAIALLPLAGWEQRFSPEVIRLAEAAHDHSPKRAACLSQQVGGDRPECTIGAAIPPSALLWGDSHGVELSWVLGQEMGARGQSLMERTHASCPPIIGYHVAKDPDCARFNQEVMARIVATASIRQVYLAAFWASSAYNQPGTIEKLDATIARLQAAGKRVIIIGPAPPQPFDVPRRLAHAAARGTLAEVPSATLADYRRDTHWFTSNYARWRARGILIIDPLKALRDGDRTRLMLDGKPLYFDSHHLSLTGTQAIVGHAAIPQFDAKPEGAGSPAPVGQGG